MADPFTSALVSRVVALVTDGVLQRGKAREDQKDLARKVLASLDEIMQEVDHEMARAAQYENTWPLLNHSTVIRLSSENAVRDLQRLSLDTLARHVTAFDATLDKFGSIVRVINRSAYDRSEVLKELRRHHRETYNEAARLLGYRKMR